MSNSEIVPAALDESVLVATRDRAAAILEEARRQGATDAEVGVSLAQGFSVTVRLGEVEKVEFNRDRGFSVTVFIGHRQGSASSTDDSEQSIRETVAAACAIARQTSEDPCAGIATAEQLARDIPDLDLFHPWEMTPDQAIEQALACEAAGRRDPRVVNSEGAGVSTVSSLRVYANSNGFLGGYRGTRHSRSCVLVAQEGDTMQRDFYFDSRRKPGELAVAEFVGEEAARRTLSRLNAHRPETGSMPVLMTPEVAAGLLSHFASAISGTALYRRSSFLQDQLGKPVFPDWVTIDERPHWPGMSGSAPFDGDGLPTREQDFVRAGELVSWALGLYAARRLKSQPTGNGGGIRNLCISDTGESADDLLKRMDDGILVTEVMGQGVNMVTGDYSRGAAGFRVQNGEKVYPVEEFTIAGHLGDMFRGLSGSGTDVDHRGNVHCGSLLIDNMKVAGT